jgi:DNA-binding transcriptional ArsR family regulator
MLRIVVYGDLCMEDSFQAILSMVKNRGFAKKMEILKFMIERGVPVTPADIYHNTGVKHYPTINYHLKNLIREGVVIPFVDKYMLQQFFYDASIDRLIAGAIEKALPQHNVDHIYTGNGRSEVLVKAFINCFLYYVTYLLYTGNFRGNETSDTTEQKTL